MAVKVKPEFIDVEKVRGAHRKIEIDISCINWKEVVRVARAEGKRIEEVLGVSILNPYSKPDGFEGRFQEILEREAKRTSRTKQQVIEETKKAGYGSYEAAERRAQELGATMDELFIIDCLSIRYSSVDKEDITDFKGL